MRFILLASILTIQLCANDYVLNRFTRAPQLGTKAQPMKDRHYPNLNIRKNPEIYKGLHTAYKTGIPCQAYGSTYILSVKNRKALRSAFKHGQLYTFSIPANGKEEETPDQMLVEFKWVKALENQVKKVKYFVLSFIKTG